MQQATHYGHCQVCGRLHKLPDGVLAKHGYQVIHRGQGGYFAGTCKGSAHRPYEQAHDALDEDIEDAKAYAAKLPSQIARMKACTETTLTVTFKDRTSAWDRGLPTIVIGEVVLTGEKFYGDKFGLRDKDGKVWKLINNDYQIDTVEQYVRKHWDGVARNLEGELRAMEHHIEMQTKRRADWKPDQPLKPVR